ncbi:MAG TPA: M23 family metallopeptidase [Methylomirabilota bacterium]|jgi:murein DD-endopeptidase MepM/ murein hydrolase activator NlpD
MHACRPLAAAALGGLLAVTAAAAPPSTRDAPSAPRPAPQRIHEVVRGDTLSSLARRYHVTVAALVAANRLPSERTTLRLRQRLLIPPSEVAAPTTSSGGKRTTLARPGRAGSPRPTSLRAPADFFFAVPDFADSLTAFIWPKEGTVTSSFGRRRLGWHRGIDIKGERGEPIVAAAPGVVVVSGVEPRYGRVVKIEHDHGFTTVYAHNDDNAVAVGDQVVTGQRIGSIGRTGRATSYHVHFEIRRDGRVYNPLYMLPLPARIAHVTETDEEEGDE